MEPERVLCENTCLNSQYFSYYFESADTPEALKGILDWFAGKGFNVTSWSVSFPYDHWYENGSEVYTYASEAELLEDMPGPGTAFFVEMNGNTGKGDHGFRLLVHAHSGYVHLEIRGYEHPFSGKKLETSSSISDTWELVEYPNFA